MNLEEIDYMIDYFQRKGDTDVVEFYQSMRRSLVKLIKKQIKGKLYV